MFFVTDRASKEEIKSGLAVSFTDIFSEKDIKEIIDFTDKEKSVTKQVAEDYKNILLFKVCNCISLLRDKKIIPKSLESLICSIFDIGEALVFCGMEISKEGIEDNYIEEERKYNVCNLQNILPIQGMFGCILINLGKSKFWWKDAEVHPGSISFMTIPAETSLQDFVGAAKFEKSFVLFLANRNAMPVNRSECIFSMEDIGSLFSKIKFKEKNRIDKEDVFFVKDIGLRNV